MGHTLLLPAEQSPRRNYHTMIALLVPRPIAWISSLGADGTVNLAPFSFYGGISADPPIVGLGISRRPDGRRKDTADNILEVGEFVIHLAEEGHLADLVACATDLEPGESEAERFGIATEPSRVVAPPSISEARVRLECRLHQHQEVGHGPVDFLMGEVVAFVVAEELCGDQGRIKETALQPVGRLGAAGFAHTKNLDFLG